MSKYALSGDDLRRELAAIDKMHEIMTPLAVASRKRILQWLFEWYRSEAPREDRDDMMPF